MRAALHGPLAVLGPLALALLAAGCASADGLRFADLPGTAERRAAKLAPLRYRIGIAPIERRRVGAAGLGAAEDAVLDAPLDLALLQQEIVDALRSERVAALAVALEPPRQGESAGDRDDAPGGDPDEAPAPGGGAREPPDATRPLRAADPLLLDAFAAGTDILLRVRVLDHRAAYEGMNGWGALAYFAYGFTAIGGAFVADERFRGALACEVEVVGIAAERALLEPALVRAEAERTLDDFDRGLSVVQLFAFPLLPMPSIYMDDDNYRLVASRLEPELRARIALEVIRRLDQGLRPATEADRGALLAREATTRALVVGVSRYRAYELHNLRFAADDARAFVGALARGAATPAKNVALVADEQASREAIRRALAGLHDHAGPADHLVVYWSGLAALAPGGEDALLVPYDFDPASPASALRLRQDLVEPLEQALAAGRGRSALVLLDAGLAGGPAGRALAGTPGGAGAAPPADGAGSALPDPASSASPSLASFARPGGRVAIACASGAGQGAQELVEAGRGLFTYHVVRAMGGAAGRGPLGWPEVLAFAAREVEAQAALVGRPQQPETRGAIDRDRRFGAGAGSGAAAGVDPSGAAAARRPRPGPGPEASGGEREGLR